jgi:hypothetical protein
MLKFEEDMLDLVRQVRQRIADETDRTEILFKIRASGRVNEGDFKITFELENEYDRECNVKGGSLEAVVDEYIRRNSWKKRNAPLCLPNVEQIEQVSNRDEIPF